MRQPRTSGPNRHIASALLALGALCLPKAARADVASWMFVGSGWSRVEGTSSTPRDVDGNHAALVVDAGLGTNPANAWVVGGVFNASGHFGYGVDLGGAVRLTTGGYSRGTWGFGFDLGPQYRFGDLPGPVGSARLLIGGPWGLGLSAGGSYGADDVVTVLVALGIDFARLTVHRSSGLDWFPNPHPSPTREYVPAHQASLRPW